MFVKMHVCEAVKMTDYDHWQQLEIAFKIGARNVCTLKWNGLLGRGLAILLLGKLNKLHSISFNWKLILVSSILRTPSRRGANLTLVMSLGEEFLNGADSRRLWLFLSDRAENPRPERSGSVQRAHAVHTFTNSHLAVTHMQFIWQQPCGPDCRIWTQITLQWASSRLSADQNKLLMAERWHSQDNSSLPGCRSCDRSSWTYSIHM